MYSDYFRFGARRRALLSKAFTLSQLTWLRFDYKIRKRALITA